jgi:hypothetical protein
MACGMEMDVHAGHTQNALLPIRLSFESDLNINDERESIKHSLQRTSTDDGMPVHFDSRQPENAFFRTRVSFESDSKVDDELDLQ